MMNPLKFAFFAIFLATGCSNFEYSPNQAFDNDSPREVNKSNISRLLQQAGDDTIRFALSGDTQRSYTNASEFVILANQVKGLDFVLLDGDISDFGLLAEMEEVHKIYSRLNVPYIAVIGNHDLAGNGENVYRAMYGDLNFSFIYNRVKFICQNTNSREFKFRGTVPDLPWIRSQLVLTNGTDYFVSVGHVPPMSEDFDQQLRPAYAAAVQQNNNMIACLYAHTGTTAGFSTNREDGAPVFVTGGIDNRKYSIVTIIHGQIQISNFSY